MLDPANKSLSPVDIILSAQNDLSRFKNMENIQKFANEDEDDDDLAREERNIGDDDFSR